MPNKRLTHFSLFSGIGGLDLAAEWAGFETVGQCEWADYPTKVLEKHWPDVPRWRDIRHVTRRKVIKTLYKRGMLHDRQLPVFIISGGFPCQPFSVAGEQKGKEDERYLWPEMLRVIRELKPRWVVAENVPGILRIAGETVCEDLEREGYSVAVFDYEAAAVGAPHRRERVFFVANANCERWESRRTESERWSRVSAIDRSGTYVANADAERQQQPKGHDAEIGRWACHSGETMAYADNSAPSRQREYGREIYAEPEPKGFSGRCCEGWRSAQSRIRRVFDELSERMDRIGLIDKTTCVVMDSHEANTNTWRNYYETKQKARPGEILRILREIDESEKVQWNIGKHECLSSEEVLRQGLHGERAGKRNIGISGNEKTSNKIPGQDTRDMRDRKKSASASQRPESAEQCSREYSNAMRLMPHEVALGRGEVAEFKKDKFFLQGLWGACTEIGYVPETLSEVQEIWKSASNEEKDWLALRIGTGNPFCEERPRVPRVATGIKDRVDRLKCLGNAVVPQQAYPIFAAIAEIERADNI